MQILSNLIFAAERLSESEMAKVRKSDIRRKGKLLIIDCTP